MLDPKTKLPTSPDLLSERLQRLQSDFPDLFTAEGNLDRASLESLFSDTPLHREQYRFEWAGKHASKRHAFTPSTARLQYDEARSVSPDEAKGDMIIEGDNLEVLKLLTSAYRGQVKCIYIDPPYNTGKDFVYPDNYTDGREAYWNKTGQVEDGVRVDTNSESAGRYHSDWLSMMHSRLLLARALLSSNGIIFASINYIEEHNLRKLMDDIFGEENFVFCFPRVTKKAGKSSDDISKNNESILVYKKDKDTGIFNRLKHTDAGFKFEDEFVETRGKFKLNQTLDYGSIQYSKSLDYEININGELFRPGNVSRDEMQERIENNPDTDFCWRWSKDLFKFGLENGFIVVKEGRNGKRIYTKTYQMANITDSDEGGYEIEYEDRDKAISSLEFMDNEYSNDNAKKQLRKVLGKTFFEYTKPVNLVKKIVEISTSGNDIILDFFAGSGTTGQAVMELNKEDGGSRQYILVQLPELTDEKSEAYKAGYKKISDITIERNKRVIQGYGESPSPLEGVGFRVYTLARSAFPRVDFAPDPEKTEEENMQALEDYIARKEAVFSLVDDNPGIIDEVVLKNGFRLDYTLTRLTDITSNTVHLVTDSTGLTAYLCLDRPISTETVSYFQSHTDKRFICLEQGLDTTAKWNLRNALGDLFVAY